MSGAHMGRAAAVFVWMVVDTLIRGRAARLSLERLERAEKP